MIVCFKQLIFIFNSNKICPSLKNTVQNFTKELTFQISRANPHEKLKVTLRVKNYRWQKILITVGNIIAIRELNVKIVTMRWNVWI